ncbi:MAG: flagellar assembly protein FliX [Alphaproteobacteria bacterium]
MSIDGINKLRGPQGTQKTGKASGSNAAGGAAFSQLINTSSEATQAASVMGASALSGLESLLSLQEVDEKAERRSKGRKKAEQMITELEGLRDALLEGTIPVARLYGLSAMVKQARLEVDDVRLQEALDDIHLRAEVELAKLEMAAILENREI